jgi:glyoxylase I family protein
MNIEHVALNVADPVAMADWYVKNLGMRVLRALNASPFTHFLADGSGRTVLELYRHEKAPVPDYRAMDPLVLHIAFLAEDVAAEQRRLLLAGATTAAEATRTPAGDVLAMLRDPWGVCVQLVKRQQALVS